MAELNLELEPEVLTDKDDTKTLPCRTCGRPCVVTRFASANKTECSSCRGSQSQTMQQLDIDESLETETLTDKTPNKILPCRNCRRGCVVTMFASASKVECLTCQGTKHKERKQEVQVKKAHTVNPAALENLADGLVNPPFRQIPLCPFDPDHEVELKHITHSPTYGPRHLEGYDGKGMPRYNQETGESVMFQCNDCKTIISYSTMHPMLLRAQNEVQDTQNDGVSIYAMTLGVREEAA